MGLKKAIRLVVKLLDHREIKTVIARNDELRRIKEDLDIEVIKFDGMGMV